MLNGLCRYGLRPFKNGLGENPYGGKFAHLAQYVQIWAIPMVYGLRPFKNGSGRNPYGGKFAHPAQYVQIWAIPMVYHI